ncbi:hypothetical protein ACW7G0_04590 [Lysobacter sp. A286]
MRGKRLGTTTAFATALAVLPGIATAVQLDYSVDVGVERNDNVVMSEVDPIEEDILRSGLGFELTHDTSAIQSSIAGRAEYRSYLGDTFSDTVDGTLEGRFNWFALPERLSFTVEDSLAVQAVNTLAANTPGNRQQVNVLSLGPNLYFDLGNTLRGRAELRYTDSDAEITDEFNSQRLGLAVRTVKELSPTSQVSLNLQGQRVDFADDVVARDYTRYDIFGRYVRDLANFSLGLDAGYSQLAYRTGDGDRSEPLLRTNIDWVPNDRHRLSLAGSQQFSDAATDALVGIGEAAAATPGPSLVGDAVVNASPYKERRLSLGYTFTGTRLGVAIEPYVNKLDYVDADEFDQEGHGAALSVGWQLRPRLSVGAFASLDHIDYLQLGIEQETRRYGIHLQRDWSRHWSSRIEWARYERRSSLPGDDADQDLLYLSVTYHR